jgi:hypothetical protein
MAESDWTKSLPRSIKLRLEGTSRYATSILEEADLLQRLSRSNLRTIQTAAFVVSLDQFLREGSEAAMRAVDTFRSVGIEGFTLGNERFEGRNEAVTRGSRLSAMLREQIVDTRIHQFLESPKSLRDLILEMGRRLARRR